MYPLYSRHVSALILGHHQVNLQKNIKKKALLLNKMLCQLLRNRRYYYLQIGICKNDFPIRDEIRQEFANILRIEIGFFSL
jgi:hypothetical protein